MEENTNQISPIPKVIHLFWFGRGKKSDLILKCIESWKKFAPDYQIKEWNEDNFDVNFCKRSRQAYEEKKWAFVADIARLKVLHDEGGIYLDTDVELIRPLDDLVNSTSGSDTFFLFLNERFINTGLGFGSVANSPVIGYLLNNYLHMNFELKRGLFKRVCTHIETEALEDYYGNQFKRNNENQVMDDGSVIISTTIWTKYSIHHGTGTWEEGERDHDIGVKHTRLTDFKQIVRNPEYFLWVRKHFGRKAEYIYEFLTYDLLDMGLLYFIKRLIKRLCR